MGNHGFRWKPIGPSGPAAYLSTSAPLKSLSTDAYSITYGPSLRQDDIKIAIVGIDHQCAGGVGRIIGDSLPMEVLWNFPNVLIRNGKRFIGCCNIIGDFVLR
jgi:hypothetical protein